MYKKILISLLLVSSLMFSPLAQAKGDIIPPIITNFVEQIPVVSNVYNALVAVVNTAVDTVKLGFDVGICGITLGNTCNVANDIHNIVENVGCVLTYGNPHNCVDLGSDSGSDSTPASQPNLSATSAPSAPQNIKITNCATTNSDGTCSQYINHGFKITWDAPASFGGASNVGYKIYRGTSSDSLTTLITTTAMNNGEKLFLENRIQDPTKPFYYKVVAFNSAGEGPASAVVEAPTDIRYLTNPLTLSGVGFNTKNSTGTQVYLINDGKDILCSGATVQDSNTITGAVCDITSAPTGDWTVKIISPDGKYSTCENCFKISLPEAVSSSVVISKTDLSDGIFKVDSVAGDNLYTGATVWVTAANGQKLNCFSLGNFDYVNSKFPGGQCNVQSFLKETGGDMSKLSVEITNDSNSNPVSLSTPAFTCTSNSYSPDPATVCGTTQITQYNICGQSKQATPSLVCSSNQVCTNGSCVGCTPKTQDQACGSWVCGNVSDGCNGTISCGTCAGNSTCVNGSCVISNVQ
jgi:hypothetical protein